MTFARYSRTLWAEEQAKAAKLAKDQQDQDVTTTKPRLRPAKVEAKPSSLSQALAKPSPGKSAENLDFSQFSRFSRVAKIKISTSDRPTLVRAWMKGVDQLVAMPPPEIYPAHAWSSLIDDADQFLKRWADQSARLGWESWEVWGVHRHAPWYRIGMMGLEPSLQGKKLVALLADAAVIETSTGNRLRYYRRPVDPLNRAERAFVWELD